MRVLRAQGEAALNPRDVLALARQRDVKLLRLHFCDLDGSGRVVWLPIGQLNQAMFDTGVELDQGLPWGRASWLPGNVRLIPDAATAILDPFASVTTLGLLCSAWDAERGEMAAADARQMLRRAVDYVAGWGRADQAWMGCSFGCWLVAGGAANGVCRPAISIRSLDAAAELSDGATADLPGDTGGLHTNAFSGWIRASAGDGAGAVGRGVWEAFSQRLVVGCVQAGLAVHDYAVGGAERGWLRLRTTVGDPLAAADAVVSVRILADQLAMQFGLELASDPLSGQPSLSAPIRLGLTSGGDCLMSGSGYGGLSDFGLAAVAGLIHHAPTLGGQWPIGRVPQPSGSDSDASLGLQPGYSLRSPNALVRVVADTTGPAERQLELQTLQLDANPYWLAATSLMAMIDGVQSRRSPGPPVEFPPVAEGATEQQPVGTLSEGSAVCCWDYLFRGDTLESAWLERAISELSESTSETVGFRR